MKQRLSFYSLYLAWIVALMATFGSLYFSEIAKFPPCVLCWYQRIFMYPLAIIIPTGMIKKDKSLPFYALPLVALGTLVAIYHNLLQFGVISEQLAPCTLGVSCTAKYISILGFITIPFLSLVSFLVIGGLMVFFLTCEKQKINVKVEQVRKGTR